jgi:hypothetical protein
MRPALAVRAPETPHRSEIVRKIGCGSAFIALLIILVKNLPFHIKDRDMIDMPFLPDRTSDMSSNPAPDSRFGRADIDIYSLFQVDLPEATRIDRVLLIDIQNEKIGTWPSEWILRIEFEVSLNRGFQKLTSTCRFQG